MKRCPKCNTEKDLSSFSRNKRTSDGLCRVCKECKAKLSKISREKRHDYIIEKGREYREKNREKRRAYQNEYRAANADAVRERLKAYNQENKEWVTECRHKKKDLPLKGSYFIGKLTIDDGAKVVEGVLTVVCKTCGARFTPKKWQVYNRHNAILGNLGGENRFYCSDECRMACPVYGHRPGNVDPRSILFFDRNKKKRIRSCQTNTLRELQCGEVGHNYCERCGDIIDVDLHHTLPISQHGKDSINPAGHILLCAMCHVEIHKDC